MFLHTPTLKKLLKNSFNNQGLTVVSIDGQLYLGGSSWAVSLDENYITNKVKGAVIELCGELPEGGQVFLATKEGNQYEVPWMERYKLHDLYMRAKFPLTETSVVISKHWNECKLFQLNINKEFKAINTGLLNVIDIREIDTNVEGTPSGPCCEDRNSTLLLWNNATCTLALCTSILDEKRDIEITNLLETIDFSKEADDVSEYQY